MAGQGKKATDLVMYVDLLEADTVDRNLTPTLRKLALGPLTKERCLLPRLACSKIDEIYATGGNDNTVAIWDLTDHAKQLKVQPIGNGKCSRPAGMIGI